MTSILVCGLLAILSAQFYFYRSAIIRLKNIIDVLLGKDGLYYFYDNRNVYSNDQHFQNDELTSYLDATLGLGNHLSGLFNENKEFTQYIDKTRASGRALNIGGRRCYVISIMQDAAYSDVFLEKAPIPIWMRDNNGALIYCNRLYREQFGAMAEIGGGSRDFAMQAMDSKEPKCRALQINLNNKLSALEITEIPFNDKAIGYAVDKTQIREWRSRFQDARKAIYGFFSASASAIAIYGVDKKLVYHNNAFVGLWNIDSSWLDSKPHFIDVLERLRAKKVLPEQVYFSSFKEKQLSLFGLILDVPQEDFWHLPDGRTIYVVATSFIQGGIIISYSDHTAQLEIERAYNTLVVVRKETLDNVNEGVSVFAENGKLKLYNHKYAEMWSLSPVFLDQEPSMREVFHEMGKNHAPKSEEVWQNIYQESIKGLCSRTLGETQIERQDGRIINLRTAPLRDGCILLTYVDVTDSMTVERSLRSTNLALEEMERLKSGFFANVAYELRSPLTSVCGYAEILKKYHSDNLNNIQLSCVDYIVKESRKLMLLISDMLSSAQISQTFESNFSIRNIILDAISEAKNNTDITDFQNVIIKHEIPADMPMVFGDENLVRQVIYKIIALSLIGEACYIDVAVTRQDDLLLLIIDHSSENAALCVKVYDLNLDLIKKLAERADIVLELRYKQDCYKGATLKFKVAPMINATN